MPGVPTGRGCDGCRKQKKKCDQLQPSCTRCQRMGIVCVGAGERRFKFIDDNASKRSQSGSRSPKPPRSSSRSRKDNSRSLSRTPSNDATTLISNFVRTFSDSCDYRYHLVWAYGDFLEQVPRRIGTNDALDTAVSALTIAHSQLGVDRNRDLAYLALRKYNSALRALRLTLDDPVKAAQTETLCACYLLLVCASYVETESECFSGHTEGAAQMLKARGYFYSGDVFELRLIQSLRGPVLMQAMLTGHIQFTREEWEDLVESQFKSPSSVPEVRMMMYWARLPSLMDRGKAALDEAEDMHALVVEARQLYQGLMAIREQFKTWYEEFKANSVDKCPGVSPEKVLHHFQRMYGLALTLCLFSNCITKALDKSKADLEADAASMCQQTFILAEEAQPTRPLGAGYIPLTLLAAWSASPVDSVDRTVLERVMIDYDRDFPRLPLFVPESRMKLELISRRLNLLSSEPLTGLMAA